MKGFHKFGENQQPGGLLTIIFTLFWSNLCYCQDSNRVVGCIKTVFIEPISLVDLVNSPCIKLGIEYVWIKNISVMTVIGYYPASGYFLKGAFKKYKVAKKDAAPFHEFTFFYKNESYPIADNIRVMDTMKGYPVEGKSSDYTIFKSVWGLNVEWGESYTRRHWVYEWFAGLGVRLKFSKASISPDQQKNLYHFRESTIENTTQLQLTNTFMPSISAGVRLGYSIKTKK